MELSLAPTGLAPHKGEEAQAEGQTGRHPGRAGTQAAGMTSGAWAVWELAHMLRQLASFRPGTTSRRWILPCNRHGHTGRGQKPQPAEGEAIEEGVGAAAAADKRQPVEEQAPGSSTTSPSQPAVATTASPPRWT